MPERKPASAELERFVDEMLQLARAHGYHPTVFVAMRHQLGVVEAISRLVQSGDLQSGFKHLVGLGLKDWTIEAAVLKFPNEFSRNARECAEFRLAQAR